MPRKKDIPLEDQLVSLGQLAKEHGVMRPTMEKRMQNLPPDYENQTNRGLDRKWRRGTVNAHFLKNPSALEFKNVGKYEDGNTPTGTKLEAETRLKTAQAIQKEMENEVAAGSLLKAGDVQDVILEASSAFSQGLESLPGRICDMFPGIAAENRQKILTECRDIRAKTADKLVSFSESLLTPGSGDSKPAT